MLIPVKCFTCGNVLADKYDWYVTQVKQQKLASKQTIEEVQRVRYLTKSDMSEANKTIEAQVLDQLKLTKMCCRRHMLTHVDMV
jgi:DNA-directed RNA polymerase subunit N (RpoN/RPB10)